MRPTQRETTRNGGGTAAADRRRRRACRTAKDLHRCRKAARSHCPRAQPPPYSSKRLRAGSSASACSRMVGRGVDDLVPRPSRARPRGFATRREQSTRAVNERRHRRGARSRTATHANLPHARRGLEEANVTTRRLRPHEYAPSSRNAPRKTMAGATIRRPDLHRISHLSAMETVVKRHATSTKSTARSRSQVRRVEFLELALDGLPGPRVGPVATKHDLFARLFVDVNEPGTLDAHAQ
jgi:hypothetical protein